MNEKWAKRFLLLAQQIATWSKDPSTRVGAVIVDADRRIVSTGYNGLPRGVQDRPDRLENRETKLRCIIHAEENALLFAKRDMKNCTLVTTHHPCSRCAGKIIQAGITKVIYSHDPFMERRWAEDILLSQQMFFEAKVEHRAVSFL